MKKKILIEWYDAKFCQGTYSEDEILERKTALFSSLGYLISIDVKTTIIASEYNNEGEYRDITLIPNGSVISIKELIPSPFM